MQFNPGDGSGIVDEIDDLCDSDIVSYPLVKKLRRVNTALEELAALLIISTGTWQFDDTNYTTRPIGRTNMVDGVATYQFSAEFLEVLDVKILNPDGKTWRILKPIDQVQTDIPLENNYAPGFPYGYDKEGGNITLVPPPLAAAVTLTQGLQVHFKRTAYLFTLLDTVVQPGFVSPFHILVARMASLPFCKTYKPDRVPQLNADIVQGKIDLVKFYGNRERDKVRKIKGKRINPR